MMVFILFWLLFDKTVENAFVNIGGNNPGVFIPERDKQFYFWIAVIRSMFFNPIGEEFLYREVIHGSFTPKFGETAASVFDSLAFALTHIAHFRLIYISGSWHFLPFPVIRWILVMFLVSQVFFRCKQYCISIWRAVCAHLGFNAMMMYLIFYHLE